MIHRADDLDIMRKTLLIKSGFQNFIILNSVLLFRCLLKTEEEKRILQLLMKVLPCRRLMKFNESRHTVIVFSASAFLFPFFHLFQVMYILENLP